jgi:hypothetical protein
MKKPAVSQRIRFKITTTTRIPSCFVCSKLLYRSIRYLHIILSSVFYQHQLLLSKGAPWQLFCGSDEIELCGDDSRKICVVLRPLSFVIGMKLCEIQNVSEREVTNQGNQSSLEKLGRETRGKRFGEHFYKYHILY